MDTLVGTTISGYTLVRLLGSGGMGAVYLAWSQDSTMLASGSADTNAKVWDATTVQVEHLLPHNGAVNSIAWEPTNTGRLATGSADGNVSIWDVNSSARKIYRGHSGAVMSVSWGLNGLASGAADNNIIV